MRERIGTAFTTGPQVREAIKQILPFHPTTAQKRVLAEIVADMRRPQPMRRLLQGDVGSGKTIVAMQAALVAIENGTQVALMAPTEILATQHYLSARKLLSEAISPAPASPTKSPSSPAHSIPPPSARLRAASCVEKSSSSSGTHALQEDKADFSNLGLVIVDEQHRRASASSSASSSCANQPPTAPSLTRRLSHDRHANSRTLALTLYGDLDVSVIDEMPPGRTPIVTRRTTGERAADVWDFVRKQVAQGRQAYLVYPVIEGSRDDQPELDFAHDDPEESPIQSVSLKGTASAVPKRAPGRKAASAAEVASSSNPPIKSKQKSPLPPNSSKKPNSAPPPK